MQISFLLSYVREFYGTLFYYTPLHLNFAEIITDMTSFTLGLPLCTGYHQGKNHIYMYLGYFPRLYPNIHTYVCIIIIYSVHFGKK